MKCVMFRAILVCFISFFAGASRVFGESDQVYRFRPGVHFSREHRFSQKQLETFLSALRFWTGLDEIFVDPAGNLELGDRVRFTHGSRLARELIIAAVGSQDSFTLERWTSSPTIAFAQIEATERYVDGSGGRHSGWVVRLDLSDFVELAGHDEARSSF